MNDSNERTVVTGFPTDPSVVADRAHQRDREQAEWELWTRAFEVVHVACDTALGGFRKTF